MSSGDGGQSMRRSVESINSCSILRVSVDPASEFFFFKVPTLENLESCVGRMALGGGDSYPCYLFLRNLTSMAVVHDNFVDAVPSRELHTILHDR